MNKKTTRREFLKKSTVAGAAVTTGLSVAQFAHAQGSGTIKIGVIGCGGRGIGAAEQALQTGKDVKLVAVGDYFKQRAKDGLERLKKRFPNQCDTNDDHVFDGFDNYKAVIASDADVILIACAAKFHPLYTKHALESGKHVFVEKPNAIDPAGVHVLEEAVKIARDKKLSLLAGLHGRYCPQFQETVKQIHDGIIGDVVTIQSNFLRKPYGVRGYPKEMNELDLQFYNQYRFNWLSGDDVTQSLVHNLDRMSWVLNGTMPTHAYGVGGRASMTERQYGNLFDHNAVTYLYKDDAHRLFAFCRMANGCFDSYDDFIIGTKGVAYWNEGKIVGEKNWKYSGKNQAGHAEEQVALFNALRKGERIDSGDYVVKSTMMAILGQMATYTGQKISWDELYNSNFTFKPNPEECTTGMTPPIQPQADGTYPVIIPGKFKWQ
ncbi:MAG: Gfo/Idh/MocA family oxidoreductase [Planctomycetaceae bacterium]|jgi:predicted dehydrogenase|nr:Gfo/Idh/MocA family oxidoreductase [Planctomycetaceae bacterium]